MDAGFRYGGDTNAPERRDTVQMLHEVRYLVEDVVTDRVDDAHSSTGWLRTNGMGGDQLTWFAE